METNAITVKNLTKSFDTIKAVNNISFEVRTGEIFGFLGPNGAGKTTTINMLTGLARPGSGSISINGVDFIAHPLAGRKLIGVVPDESNLYPELSGIDNLRFCASLYGIAGKAAKAKAGEMIEAVGLKNAAERKFGTYSKGMKRKLTIAAGIIHNPPILFLDEPTTGIDIEGAKQIRELIGNLNRTGTTIFLTTHYIEEAQRLCDMVAFIVGGQIVHKDSMRQLIASPKDENVLEVEIDADNPEITKKVCTIFPDTKCDFLSANSLRIASKQKIPLTALMRFFEDIGIEVTEIRKIRRSLEDAFIEITGLAIEKMKSEKAGGGK